MRFRESGCMETTLNQKRTTRLTAGLQSTEPRVDPPGPEFLHGQDLRRATGVLPRELLIRFSAGPMRIRRYWTALLQVTVPGGLLPRNKGASGKRLWLTPQAAVLSETRTVL